MPLPNPLKLFLAIGASLSAGAIGSVFTARAVPTWYAGLVQPALNPPAWVFGPVWTVLYILMGIAAFWIWRNGWNRKNVRVALGVFGVQLLLNVAWSMIFFGLQRPGWALVSIVILWLAIVWTMVLFYKISRPAAYLLAPYLLWVTFASYLDYSIWMLN